MSVGALFFNFIIKKVAPPSKLGLVTYLLLLFIMWYAFTFIFRFLLSLAKLVVLVLAALFLCRVLSRYDTTGVTYLFLQISSQIINNS